MVEPAPIDRLDDVERYGLESARPVFVQRVLELFGETEQGVPFPFIDPGLEVVEQLKIVLERPFTVRGRQQGGRLLGVRLVQFGRVMQDEVRLDPGQVRGMIQVAHRFIDGDVLFFPVIAQSEPE